MHKPLTAARRMVARYGRDAPIHATYNMMGHDRASAGWRYWSAVLDCLRALERRGRGRARAARRKIAP